MVQLSGIKVRASLEIGHRLINKKQDDQFIVAHPRSGSTWLRTILVNIIVPTANSDPDIFNSMIPGVSIRKAITRINHIAPPRIIMSHTNFRKGIPSVLYMVRDGRDVLVSYYHYMCTRQRRSMDFTNFFARYIRGGFGHLWPENVESWLEEGKNSLKENLMVIRFEDFKSEPERIVSKVTEFLNIEATSDQISRAVQLANIEHMREIEKSRIGDLSNENMSFYRGGKTGQWEEYFSPQLEVVYRQITMRAMNLAGYDW